MNGMAYISLEARFAACAARDVRADGQFFVAVRTTRIFCRPVCAAKPKPENMRFYETREACILAGFRACKRCKP